MEGNFISCPSGRMGNEVGDEKETAGGASGLGCKYKQILNVDYQKMVLVIFFYLWSGDGIE